MAKFKPWDIWLAEVKFEDINQSKLRPVIILETSQKAISVIKLSSKPPKFKSDYALKLWKESGLKKPTTVKTRNYILISTHKFIFRIGEIQTSDKSAIIDLIKIRPVPEF
jgi:hypothetical protein